MQMPFTAQSHHILPNWHKLFTWRRQPKLREQLSASELTHRLNEALLAQNMVTLQVNVSAFSERIYNLRGFLYQTPHGRLYVETLDGQLRRVDLTLLRNVQ